MNNNEGGPARTANHASQMCCKGAFSDSFRLAHIDNPGLPPLLVSIRRVGCFNTSRYKARHLQCCDFSSAMGAWQGSSVFSNVVSSDANIVNSNELVEIHTSKLWLETTKHLTKEGNPPNISLCFRSVTFSNPKLCEHDSSPNSDIVMFHGSRKSHRKYGINSLRNRISIVRAHKKETGLKWSSYLRDTLLFILFFKLAGVW